jgi:cytidylate kinase
VPEYRNIVISGPPASGKSTLVQELAIRRTLRTYSVGDMLRKEYTDKYPNKELSFETWRLGLDLEYNRKAALSILPILDKGDMIVDSRFVSFLDKSTNLLVFITAGIETRATRCLDHPRYAGKSFEQIKKELMKREEDEVELGIKLFGKDYRDHDIYHLILNSEILSVQAEFNGISGAFGYTSGFSVFTTSITAKS